MTNETCMAARCNKSAMPDSTLCKEHYDALPAPMRGEQPTSNSLLAWLREKDRYEQSEIRSPELREIRYGQAVIALTIQQADIERLHRELAHAHQIMAAAYQLAGVVGAPVRFLDALALHDDVDIGSLLPVSIEECEEFKGSAHEPEEALDDHSALLKKLPNVRGDLLEELKPLSKWALIRRVLIQADWLGSYSRCIDGFEFRGIPGSGIDSARNPRDIRRIVEHLRASQPPSTAPTLRAPIDGPFEVWFKPKDGSRGVMDDRNGITLTVHGFVDDNERRKYCEELANTLNARASQPPKAWNPHDGVEPLVEQNDTVIPIEIGVGKVRIAKCWSADDPQKVVRELVIYDDGGEQQPPGTEQPEHRGKKAWDIGRILARVRIVDAVGAQILLSDLQEVIDNARLADATSETKGESHGS